MLGWDGQEVCAAGERCYYQRLRDAPQGPSHNTIWLSALHEPSLHTPHVTSKDMSLGRKKKEVGSLQYEPKWAAFTPRN